MTFEEHAKAIHDARNALNDAIHNAAHDGLSFKFTTWNTTISAVETIKVGRGDLSAVIG